MVAARRAALLVIGALVCLLGVVAFLSRDAATTVEPAVREGAAAGPVPFEALFPEGLEAGFLARFEDLPLGVNSHDLRFSVDDVGRPFLAVGNAFIALRENETDSAGSVRLPDVERIDHFAWMRDGALMVVSGRKLGEVTEAGFVVIQELPSAGMKVEPASVEEFYIYGGDTPAQARNVYVYRKGGGLMQLVRGESPVSAVAGDGKSTLFAVGEAIYLHADGEPVRILHTTDGEVTSLAMAPQGLFYSTTKGVGYISGPGKGFEFLKGKGAELQVSGDALYLFFADEGIMRLSPVSSFEGMATDLDGERPGSP